MAKKKPRPKKGPKGSAGKAPKRAKPRPGGPAGLPDRRAIEGKMWNMFGASAGPGGPLDEAQQIMYSAFDERSPAKRAALARKALGRSPDCADAYVLLAEQADSAKEALHLYEQAVAAGERALGPRAFREDVGHFWGLLETRPYMRAREGLAVALWSAGRREEAAAHARDMLRLNPNDNQGVRYTLAAWLLDLGRDDELARLLDQYDEGTAAWAYNRALLAFRRHGDSAEAGARLAEARKANPHVPDYLVGRTPLPSEQPPYYGLGDDNEAVIYVGGALSAWRSTPGALAWLRAATAEPAAGTNPKAKRPKAAGPSAAAKGRLKRLPQEDETWQADCRPLDTLVEHEGKMTQPWVGLVVSRSRELILAQAMELEPLSAPAMWDLVSRAMSEPLVETPRRPTRLEIRPGPVWDELRPHLEDVGVACVAGGDVAVIGEVIADLSENLTSDEPPGLLEMPGVTPDQAAAFYRAAADFYRQAPWKRVGFQDAIRIACDRYESGPWYALVMGQSGLTLGLALYEDMDLVRRMWAGSLSDKESARRTVALTVTFDPEAQIPTADLLAARRHGWEVVDPDAHPSVFRKERGLSMRAPLAWELELMEGALRAVPEFLSRHQPDDTTPHTLTVPVASGELTLTLAWVGDA
jgi:hypothetical protein